MLKFLKREANTAYTANGAVSNASTMSDCLDFFATAGALRNAYDEEIVTRFIRAFAEDKDIAMKILFYARDIRGGLGERRAFRVILKYLAQNYPETVIKNIGNIAEYGRYDDILSLMDTACEQEATAYIKAVLTDDMKSMQAQDSVSLMAKWLPSVNASSKETVRLAKKIAKAMKMSDASYRRMLSALRAYIKILENNLREKDYTFSYEKQPSKALFKYRKAFFRNDGERYSAFISKAMKDPSVMKTGSLTPYDIVNTVIRNRSGMASSERKALDTTWNALENYVNSGNTLAVVDGSGSMYCSCFATQPAAVAESLGIYFAERNKGAFANCFITFSSNPRLVEIKGKDIFEKVRYCMSYNECSNTNIEKTFDLILNTAVKNRMKQADMPSRLIIISDMEFDCCASDASMTNFESAKAKFVRMGYKLPQVVFWNVNSFTRQQPVRMNDQGAILVSGMSPQIFAMLKDDKLDPYSFMMSVISSERYERVAA
ncbi:MAG: DUF2828 family protein [Ruminococcaceae bacterium]|nr:DUF2828 family protein [Oscillospiraceae bacterium]